METETVLLPVPPKTRLLQLPPELLTCGAVAALLMVHERTLWRMVQRGEFPQPIRWNKKLVRWPAAEVYAFVDGIRGQSIQ